MIEPFETGDLIFSEDKFTLIVDIGRTKKCESCNNLDYCLDEYDESENIKHTLHVVHLERMKSGCLYGNKIHERALLISRGRK